MLNVIISSIRNRHTLTFSYGGIQRTVEPHIVGISKLGNDVLRCYQTDGESQGWLLCELAKITKLIDTGTSFTGTRPDYKRRDPDMMPAYVYAAL